MLSFTLLRLLAFTCLVQEDVWKTVLKCLKEMWLRSLRGCLGWKSPRCPRGDTERVANIVPNYFMRTCLLLDRQYCGDIWRNCPLEFVGPPQVKSTITFEVRF